MTRIAALLLAAGLSSSVLAADYVIDGTGAGMHAAVNFKANHLGISALWGRFNDIRGEFSYDADKPGDSRIEMVIATASLDSNHAARDEHLISSDYLDAEQYPEARFISSEIERIEEGVYEVRGDFSLHGVTREISFEAHKTGEGQTPFGDYRVGFEAMIPLDLTDYGMATPPDSSLDLYIAIEGIER